MSDINKVLSGVLSTSPDRQVSEEPYPSRLQSSPNGISSLLSASTGLASLRVLPDLTLQALFNETAPTNHPQRNRKLIQEKLLCGANIWAEGTDGSSPGGTSFDTGGIDVTGYSTSLLLVVTNTADGAGVYTISALAGTSIILNQAVSGAFASAIWYLIEPSPVQLLGVPSQGTGNTQETTFLTVLPSLWPVSTKDTDLVISGTNFSGTAALQPDGRILFTGTHSYPSAVFVQDEIATLQVSIFGPLTAPRGIRGRVLGVVFTPGIPNTEVVTIEPLYDEEIQALDRNMVIRKVAQVRDFFNDIYGTVEGESLFHNVDLLNSIRLFPLIAPQNSDPNLLLNSPAQVLNPNGLDFVPDSSLGYNIVLYPPTLLGAPDVTRPITDLNNVNINSNFPLSDQSIYVDYARGAVILSHPIGNGDDLNPNGYTSPDGNAILFASFVVYNSSCAPYTVQGLKTTDQDMNTASLEYRSAISSLLPSVSPITQIGGWEVRTPEDGALKDYHLSPTLNTTNLTSTLFTSGQALSNESTPQVAFQYKSEGITFIGVGGITYGPRSIQPGVSTPQEPTQQIALLPAVQSSNLNILNGTNQALSTTGHSYLSVSEGTKELLITGGGLVTTGVNDILILYLNDIVVAYTLPNGIVSASSLKIALDAAIVAAGLASDKIQTSGVNFETKVEGANLRLFVRDFLVVGDGTANGVLGLIDWQRVQPTGVALNSFVPQSIPGELDVYVNQLEIKNRLRYTTSGDLIYENSATFNGTDIDLKDGSSLRSIGSIVDNNYAPCVLSGASSVIGGSPDEVDISAGSVFYLDRDGVYRRKDFNSKTLTVGGVFGLYYVYYNSATEDLAVINATVTPGFDPTLQSGPVTGVPLARLVFNGVNIVSLYDARSFARKSQNRNVLTVGTNGQFEDLNAAVFWIAERPSDTNYTIQLVSDIDINIASINERTFLPSNTTLDGNGYTLSLSLTGPLTNAFNIFSLQNPISAVSSRNVEIKNLTVSILYNAGAFPPNFISDNGSISASGISEGSLTLRNIRFLDNSVNPAFTYFVNVIYACNLLIEDCYTDDITFEALTQPALGLANFNVEVRKSVFTLTHANSSSAVFQAGNFHTYKVIDCEFTMPFSGIGTGASFVRDFDSNANATFEFVNTTIDFVNLDFLSLTNSSAKSNLKIIVDNCNFSFDDDTTHILTTSSTLRYYTSFFKKTTINRVSPTLLTAAAGGFLLGTTGATEKVVTFEDCTIDNLTIQGDLGDLGTLNFTNVTFDSYTFVDAQCAVPSGSLAVNFVNAKTLDAFQGNFLNIKRVTTNKSSFIQTGAITPPVFTINDCEFVIDNSEITKTTSLGDRAVFLSGDFGLAINGLVLRHGNGTAVTEGISIDATASLGTISTIQISNLRCLYLAAQPLAVGIFFDARAVLTNANFVISNFYFEGYQDGGLNDSLAITIGNNWDRFIFSAGFVVGDNTLTTFAKGSITPAFHVDASVLFVA